MQYKLPYGNDFESITIPDSYSVEYISENKIHKPIDVRSEIKKAFSYPLASPTLSDIVKIGDKVAIIIDDHTRPCPSKLLLPYILSELKKANVSHNDITILIATGTHRPPNKKQIVELVGKEILHDYNIVSNDNQSSEYVSIGRTSFDHEIKILKDYVDADVKIILSDIEYHYFAGYGGTRKSILPGIASADSIEHNHAMMFDKYATTGEINRNPISREMDEVLEMIGCDFSIGTVLDKNHQPLGIWAGESKKVMDEGVKLVKSMYSQKISRKPDLIITAADGYPHDINLYQSLKAIHSASAIIKDNGAIILSAKCDEGMGNSVYRKWIEEFKSSYKIRQQLKHHFVIGAHKAYYHRELLRSYDVYLKSLLHPDYVRNHLDFRPVHSIQDAVDEVLRKRKTVEHICIIPNGSTTLLKV